MRKLIAVLIPLIIVAGAGYYIYTMAGRSPKALARSFVDLVMPTSRGR
jgi:hypothetical protein